MHGAVVLRHAGDAFGSSRLVGRYLASYDLEANGGRGEATWTARRDAALVFLSFTAAYTARGQSPACCPLRDDGKPNRPLTAYSMVFEDAPCLSS